jgi:3-oxo-5-alpha-steroid 4-dehydrogenase 1
MSLNFFLSKTLLYSSFIYFILLWFIPAPYGRYITSSTKTVSAKWTWFLQESPNLYIPLYWLYHANRTCLLNPINLFLLSLFLFHYLYRSIFYPLKRLSSYHKPVPLYTFTLSFLFCSCNSQLQASLLLNETSYPVNWLIKPSSLLGVFLFFLGWSLHYQADTYLTQLKRQSPSSSYRIPENYLFHYISCPNYLGEIIQWIGYAFLCQHPYATLFAWTTFANLLPRAYYHHSWYKSHFFSYPPSRKAIFPFIL